MKDFLVGFGVLIGGYFLWKMGDGQSAQQTFDELKDKMNDIINNNSNNQPNSNQGLSNVELPEVASHNDRVNNISHREDVIVLQEEMPINDMPFLIDSSILNCYNTDYDATQTSTKSYDVVM